MIEISYWKMTLESWPRSVIYMVAKKIQKEVYLLYFFVLIEIKKILSIQKILSDTFARHGNPDFFLYAGKFNVFPVGGTYASFLSSECHTAIFFEKSEIVSLKKLV